jgi:ABC-type branched-subunit amino acid transport system substrate-binding protein
MSKHILFKIDSGSFAKGFCVTLHLLEEGQVYRSVTGQLPANIDLFKSYSTFRQAYFCQDKIRTVVPNELFRIVVPPQITHPKGCWDSALELKKLFQSWLDCLTEKVQTLLVYGLMQPDLAQFMLQTQDIDSVDTEVLAKLPWHVWHFFEDYQVPEITLGCLPAPIKREPLGNVVKILAILGHSEGINTQQDLQTLRSIWGAWVTELKQPSRQQLSGELWRQSWDILFFAGHSHSEGITGRIYINDKEENLTLEEIQYALKEAGKNGLKMAIFNSCDGLRLVPALVNASVPWMVVMREPVPDEVAQRFLKYFLTAFSQGEPFVLAIQKARQQLEGIQDNFPCATWLPIALQSPLAVPLVWPCWAIWLNRFTAWLNYHFSSVKNKVNQKIQVIRRVVIAHQKFIFIVSIMILSGLVSTEMQRQPQPEPQLGVACDEKNVLASQLTSCGGKSDFISLSDEDAELLEKKQGTIAFANKNFTEAVDYLSKAWEQKQDPSTLIALNNAYVMRDLQNGTLQKDDVFAIAIASGFKKTPKEIGGSILAGVAWRQKEVNNKGKLKLLVVMSDDQNDPEIALKIAKELVENEQILGVIGPYSSRATYYVLDTYRNKKMVLVSSTSTATIEAYKNEDKNICQDLSWFFRPIPTTKIGAEALIKYLEKKGYKYIKIFYQDKDLFGKSFYMDFRNSLKNSSLNIINPSVQYIDKTEAQIAEEIINLKKTYDHNKTALVVLADAYTNANSRPKKIKIVSENKGVFFLAGSNTLFENEFLNLYPKKISKESLEKSIISIPWYPSAQSLQKLNRFFKIKSSDNNLRFWSIDNPQLTWHMAMSYDATQMFIEAISQEVLSGRKPTRAGLFHSPERLSMHHFSEFWT